jgi:excisionase family DNA binding protein
MRIRLMDDVAERARAARETCPFLTAKQAAFHLGLAYSTMKAMRARGSGPACRLHGRTWRYHIEEIEAWSQARRRGGDHG